jgi:predicted N-acetyltransferase YhbS
METAIRPMQRDDLPEVDRIIRLAFGTFLGVPDPMTVFGDSDFAFTRFAADPGAALAATGDGQILGSNFATDWGSVGFFGPLSIEPRLWDQKIAQRLLETTIDLFAKWGCRHTGLFHLQPQPQTCCALSEVWFLVPLFDAGDVVADQFVQASCEFHRIFATA